MIRRSGGREGAEADADAGIFGGTFPPSPPDPPAEGDRRGTSAPEEPLMKLTRSSTFLAVSLDSWLVLSKSLDKVLRSRSWPSFVLISRMIFSSIATLAAPSMEYGFGLSILSKNGSSENGEGTRGSLNFPVGGGVAHAFGGGSAERKERPYVPLDPREAGCGSCERDVFFIRSFSMFLISSSRAFVASLRLIRSVALSLLRRDSCDISR